MKNLIMVRKYINYPKKVNLSYYENARNEIINYFLEDKSLESIYEFGTVKAPGVSDIDIMLIFKTNPLDINRYDFKEINKRVYSLVENGNVIKMGKNTFSCLDYIDNFNLKLIKGKDIKQNIIPNNLKKLREIISICDWLPERIKRIEMILSKSNINISNILCLLHSITYSLKNVEILTNKIHLADKLIDQISALRTEWYELNCPEEMLIDTCELAIEVGLDAIYKLTDLLIKTIPVNLCESNYSPIDISVPLHYEIKLEFDESLSFNTLEYYKKNKVIKFPGIFAFHFINLAILPTQISNRLSLKLFNKIHNPYLDLENEYINYLFIKSTLISENLNFIEMNKFKGGLIRYGFYA